MIVASPIGYIPTVTNTRHSVHLSLILAVSHQEYCLLQPGALSQCPACSLVKGIALIPHLCSEQSVRYPQWDSYRCPLSNRCCFCPSLGVTHDPTPVYCIPEPAQVLYQSSCGRDGLYWSCYHRCAASTNRGATNSVLPCWPKYWCMP